MLFKKKIFIKFEITDKLSKASIKIKLAKESYR